MNIYEVTEDGARSLIQAQSIIQAVTLCEELYIENLFLSRENSLGAREEREHYRNNILTSCVLVGPLKK